MSTGARPLGCVAVYCGSSTGSDPRCVEAAARLGEVLARREIAVVYGGGQVGLMGVVADAALAAGGEVHGVITRALELHEVAHGTLTTLTVVDTMHERKAAMADRADAFVMLPGGFGTLDEFFEVVTWTQLGIHAKPCGIVEVAGYFAPLLAWFDGAVAAGFVRPEHRASIVVETEPAALVDRLARWRPAVAERWLDADER